MGIKIVFSDIDATFLTNHHEVTERTEYMVKSLLGKGIPFVLVSARMPEAIYPITKEIGVNIPIISYGGAMALTEKEEVLFSRTLPKDSCTRVLRLLEERWQDAVVNYYAGRHWYVREITPPVQREMDITSARAEVRAFEEMLQENVLPNKLLVMAERELCEEIEQELRKAFPELSIVRSYFTLLEVMDRSVSKAAGIEVMLRHFGLKAEEAIAFGDNYNDMEMLQYVGCGVAMGNALPEVKELADEITLTNEEDGIHVCLKEKGIIA